MKEGSIHTEKTRQKIGNAVRETKRLERLYVKYGSLRNNDRELWEYAKENELLETFAQSGIITQSDVKKMTDFYSGKTKSKPLQSLDRLSLGVARSAGSLPLNHKLPRVKTLGIP